MPQKRNPQPSHITASPEIFDIEAGYLRSCGWHEDQDGGWSHKSIPSKSVDLTYAVAVQILKHVKGAA